MSYVTDLSNLANYVQLLLLLAVLWKMGRDVRSEVTCGAPALRPHSPGPSRGPAALLLPPPRGDGFPEKKIRYSSSHSELAKKLSFVLPVTNQTQ